MKTTTDTQRYFLSYVRNRKESNEKQRLLFVLAPPVLLSKAPNAAKSLVPTAARGQNFSMRAIAGLLAAVALAAGVYFYYIKRMPTTDEGTAATQAISLTGVRADLLQIANAERQNIALNSKCQSIDELMSSGALTVNKKERDGYSYEISCSGGEDFSVTAEHPPAAANSGIRYPKLAIDASMQVREVQ
jgi:hypothetical protein